MGGAFALDVRLGDGTLVRLRGAYRDVDPPRSLAHTLRALGHPDETVVTWELRPDGEGTMLALSEAGPGVTDETAAGWAAGLDLIEEALGA